MEAVRSVSCRLCSSPSKSADLPGAAYRCSAEVFWSSGEYGAGGASSASAGRLSLTLPPSFVEAFYPGRLYSGPSAPGLVEEGAFFLFTGRWNRATGLFEVSGAQDLGWGRGLSASFYRIRAVARLYFRRILYAWGRPGGLVLALLSGSRDYLDTRLIESFRRTGLSHVLALSGMHLSFVSSFFGLSAARLFGKRHSFLPRLFAVCLFAFFAGFSPSLFRAFLFTLLLSFCSRFHVSQPDAKAVLGVVFLLHVLLRKDDLWSPAFMLSYAAIAGILFFTRFFEKLLVPVLPPVIASSLAASSSAFMATAPISWGIFGYLAPVGILASVAVSPLVGLFLLMSLVSVAASLAVPALSPLCGGLLGVLYLLIDRTASLFALLPSFGSG